MKHYHKEEPQITSSTAQRWAWQAACAPQDNSVQEEGAYEVQGGRNRREWRALLVHVIIIPVIPLLAILWFTAGDQEVVMLACNVVCLILPLLILVLYYQKIIVIECDCGGTQEVAFPLLFSTIISCLYAMGLKNTAYLNVLQFAIPFLVVMVLLIVLNVWMKRKKGRWMVWYFMFLWIPSYAFVFVVMLNWLVPVKFREVPSEIDRSEISYIGDGFAYSLYVSADGCAKPLVFHITEDVYDRITYDTVSSVTMRKGILGIDYARLKLSGLEPREAED